MFAKSFPSLHRLCGYALTPLVLCGLFADRTAQAQATTPAATASFANGLTHPTGWGTLLQTAIDTFGDWIVVDFANGAAYEFPAGGGAMITLAAPGSLGGVGGYQNPGIAIDGNNTLYVEANFNNCMLSFPYSGGTWPGLATLSPTNQTTTVCPNNGSGTSPYIFAQYGLTIAGTTNKYPGYFQPVGLAADSHGNIIIGTENSGNFIFTLNAVPPGSKSTTGNMIVAKMTKRAVSLTADPSGNIYFVEDSGGLPGVYMVPTGSTDLASDAGLTRVDPLLPNVVGVSSDAAGNLYIADSKLGIFFVPNPTGTPNTAAAQLLSPVSGNGQPAVDTLHQILYVSTGQKQSNGEADVAVVRLKNAEFGSTATGAPAAAALPIYFGFNSAVTPASFVVQEAGASVPDFLASAGGTCAAGTAYAAQANCTQNVTLSPHAAGSVSAKLVALDANGNTLAAINLHGTGTGSSLQVLPALETNFASGFKTPDQIAVDAAGNTYVADSGLAQVLAYPKGSATATVGVAVGTGLVAPTGVAADGAGDVYIADSGKVYLVPEGATGPNSAAQALVKSGLGANLRLATDGVDHLFVADPANHRIVKLQSIGGTFGLGAQQEFDLGGFNAPSALATDQSNNLYVADGSNLIEVTPQGTQTTLLTTLNNPTGLAVDASGAVYVTETGGTIRIPSVGGALTPGSQTLIGTSVSAPASVALDANEDVYLLDPTGAQVHLVSSTASLNFGTLTSTSATASQTATITNAGNAALTVTGYAGTADYTSTADTCTAAPVAPGTTCTSTITLSPGPGDQGTLAGEVTVTGNEANTPVGADVTGVGATLAASATTITPGTATIDGAPITVAVAPATASAGAATPTGTVTLTVTGNGITPVVTTQTLAGGKASFSPTQLVPGTYTFAVAYGGDRNYGTSNASKPITVASGPVTIVQPAPSAVPQYALSAGQGAAEPYDGSQTTYYYNYPLSVTTTNGLPLVPIMVQNAQKQTVPYYGTVTYALANGTLPCGTTGSTVPVGANGTAPLAVNCLPINNSNTTIPNLTTTYTLIPTFSGYANYAPATGVPVTLTVIRNPSITLSATPAAFTVPSGGSATTTITLTSLLGYGVTGVNSTLNNYSLPVTMNCDGLPAHAACSFAYPKPDPTNANTVDVTPSAPGQVVMTITTNASVGSTTASNRSDSGTAAFATLFGFGLLGLALGKRRTIRGRLLALVCVLTAGATMACVTACSTKVFNTQSSPSTPTGTYNVTVTAQQAGSKSVPGNNPGTTQTVYGNENQMSIAYTVSVTIQ